MGGVVLRVDMSSLDIRVGGVPRACSGLAGRGLTSAMVAAEVPAGCHPLGRHNKLVIAPGALSGTEAPNSGRLSIGLKSPLTGGIKESNVGGTAAYRLGRLGLAAIVIEGLPHEERPYLLVVTKDGGRLISCSAYRGLKNYELVKALHTAYGEKAAILSVGPAGEMMLPVATVACTDTAGLPCRHAGRGGTGAVMGAKGLKAIIIDDADGPGVTIADAEKFRQGAKRLAKALRDHPLTGQALRLLGTNLFAGAIDAAGAYPTRNFRRGTFEGIDRVSGEYMYEVITRRGGKPSRAGCSLCTIECSNVYLDEQGGYITSALEYGTIWAHGANLDISDLDSIAKADRLCDDYGIDTLEIGQAIGVAMEAGIKQFGDAPGALELIEEVGRGTSLGKILGNGAWATGRAFGATRIPCVKRQAMAAYDPRAIHGMGVTYATSPMGADHTAGWVVHTNLVSMGGTLDPHNPDGQVDNCRRVQVFTAAMDCTGLCNFTHLPIVGTDEGKESFLSMMNGLYGKEFAFEDIMTLGKELLETEHGFNLAAGFTRADDRLPEFMKEETLPPHNVKFTVPDDELDRFWGEFR